MDTPKEPIVTANDLPMTFQVKYLGHQPAKGLWGIKHTRRPVDTMVASAKSLPPGTVLPYIKVEISLDGLKFWHIAHKRNESATEINFKIDSISYGVQDLVYTRVFSMIIVKEDVKSGVPFDCHGFVCESRNQARQLTYALAAAFQEYGKRVKDSNSSGDIPKKKFAIDLRSPEELQEASDDETEA